MARDASRRSRLGERVPPTSRAMNDGRKPDANVTPTPMPTARPVPPPEPPRASSRQVQWIIAAVLLAGLVFAAVFAMNYLPSMVAPHDPTPVRADPDSDL